MGPIRRNARCIAAAIAAMSVASCGGGDGTTTVSDPVLREDFTEMQERLDGLFNTAFLPGENAIPASGSATFSGFVNMAVGPGSTPLDLTGRTTVSIDFGTRALTGSAGGFEALDGGETVNYAGQLTYRNGRIGRDEVPPTLQQPNDVRLDYFGTLVGDGNTVVVDGSAAGKLKGSPIAGLVASAPAGATARLNGASVPSTFDLVAEID